MDDENEAGLYETVQESFDDLAVSQSLSGFVMNKCEVWRDHYETNYQEKFEEYYRLWRGQWDPADRTRDTERSKIITPALQQAVESNVAELEEATFGRGKWFDVKDNYADQEKTDMVPLRANLEEDFEYCKVRKAVAECLINAAVFGTGVAEITMDLEEYRTPKQIDVAEGLAQYGVQKSEKVAIKMRPVLPQNFLIDPIATSVDDASGVAIDEFVPRHQVEQLQEKGVYADVYLQDAGNDTDIEPDREVDDEDTGKIRLTKYYGLVPTALLKDSPAYKEKAPEGEELSGLYTEAVVIIGNGGVVLKAQANPYMMQDRPVVAFPWDIVPSRFWGRGVAEKGYNSQKALDAEIRGRIDALALTIHPMMAMDANRIPRGAKPEVRPGKTILTSGNPNEVLQPLNFGRVDQITFAQAGALQQMVQQATGAVDSAGIAGQVNGEATAAGISMSLGAIIKRHKRTLINFQQSFLLPFVQKAAWRYMQYDPERYPTQDYSFTASSTLGIIAREYEVTQLTQLLQTMSPESPLYGSLIQSVVENMNLSNREELVATLKEASKPDPKQQQMAEEAHQKQIQQQDAQIGALQAEANRSNAAAKKALAEAEAVPIETQAKVIQSSMGDLQDDQEGKDFDRRLQVLDKMGLFKKLRLEEQKHNDDMKLKVMQELKNNPDNPAEGLGQ